MIWYDMIWYDVIWYDMIWYDMIWYDMIWYDMIWYDMIWYDMIWWCDTWHDIFINCSWVVTRWQYTFTHNQYIKQTNNNGTTQIHIKYVLFISHNTTRFIRYLFKLTTISAYIFRPSSGHKNVCLEEVIHLTCITSSRHTFLWTVDGLKI